MEKDLDTLIKRMLDESDSLTYADILKEFNKDSPEPDTSFRPSLQIKYVNKSENENPSYATEFSSGFDLRANENIILAPNEYAMVSTGLFFELPEGFEIQVRPRSGLAAKHGVTVLNTPGTVDSDYRGEVKVILINHGKQGFAVAKGDRIAQAIVAPVWGKSLINLTPISEINEDTVRGAGGFGSTGTA